MKPYLVHLIAAFIFSCLSSVSFAQLTPYELHGKNYTATYQECIDYYKQLDRNFKCVSMQTMGMTDAGLPLHVVLISSGKNNPTQWHDEKKVVFLINNGIHPGEPDGIDASMMLVRDLATTFEENDSFPQHVALAIIPVYNIGGCLLRNEFHRIDQNGPESFGERGNSQNLDLNRDFIKCDSKEARSFAEIFHWIQPDIFIDNHVSDGADYQHVMTLASTQHNKLGDVMGDYLHQQLEPAIYARMKTKGYSLIPYVNVWGKDARQGWSEFFDGPRYSGGYAAMNHVFAFTFESHMLKPYPQRVDGTYQLMQSMISFASEHSNEILEARKNQIDHCIQQKTFPLAWINDTTAFSNIEYQGYTYKTKTSQLTGLSSNYYDHNEPYTQQIKFYNTYKPSVTVEAPQGYIVPQAWWKVIELLKLNQVEMIPFEETTRMNVEAYTITNYVSGATPYEGHHGNSKVEVETHQIQAEIQAGDYYIPLNQEAKRFIIEVLEPQGGDSYFSWNFFDPILIQKEGYSEYAYEQYAFDYVKQHPELQTMLDDAKKSDPDFAKNNSAQLEFIYKHSPYAEQRFKRYPVFRVTESSNQIPELHHIEKLNSTSSKHDE